MLGINQATHEAALGIAGIIRTTGTPSVVVQGKPTPSFETTGVSVIRNKSACEAFLDNMSAIPRNSMVCFRVFFNHRAVTCSSWGYFSDFVEVNGGRNPPGTFRIVLQQPGPVGSIRESFYEKIITVNELFSDSIEVFKQIPGGFEKVALFEKVSPMAPSKKL